MGTELGKCFWAAMKRAVTEAGSVHSAPARQAAENLPGLFTMGVAEEGGEFVASLSLVLVVPVRFGRRCARRGARCFGAVRCVREAILAAPNWRAQMVWMCAKVSSLSSSRSSRIWSYAARRAWLSEDLRIARMTDRKTSSMVKHGPERWTTVCGCVIIQTSHGAATARQIGFSTAARGDKSSARWAVGGVAGPGSAPTKKEVRVRQRPLIR
jgi:hypothetical protein